MNKTNLHPDVRVGNVHLRVADVQRSLEFYRSVLGFQILCDNRSFGLPIVFLSAGDDQRHIVLDASETSLDTPSLLAAQTSSQHTSFHHVAISYPNPSALEKAVKQFCERDAPISVFLKDPDGNELELYYDHPRNEWFDDVGKPIIKNEKSEAQALLRELENN
jgi:catechol 2,3-dioxygenase